MPYAARSWAIFERSQEASGLPLVFLLKTLIPVFAAADGAAGRRADHPAAAMLSQGALNELAETLAILMVVAMVAALMAGYPVALTLAGVSLAFAVLGDLTGAMSFAILGALPQRIFGVMTNEVLLAIPLFIFMGVMLERSRIAEDLLETMGRLFGALRGGLGILGRHRRHAAGRGQGRGRRHHRDHGPDRAAGDAALRLRPRLAAGTVAATATLAQIFPPATVLVLLGDQLGNAYQAAQLVEGQFRAALAHGQPICSPARWCRASRWSCSISSMSVAVAMLLSESGAAAAARSESAARHRARAQTGRSPDRSACAHYRRARLDPRRHRDADRGGVRSARSARYCSPRARRRLKPIIRARRGEDRADHGMIFLILIGATMFSLVFRALGGDEMVHAFTRQSAGRRGRRRAHGDGRDVPARLRDGCVRDHLRGRADRRARRC